MATGVDLSLSGLASGFDWKSLVDKLIQVDSAPIAQLNREKSTNNDKLTSLSGLLDRVDTLQTAAHALRADGLFNARKAASTTANSTWSATAAAGAAAGSYQIAVSQVASAARRVGASDLASGLSATSDVSGLTLSTLRIATAVTAGTFSINGNQVTIATTDSLDQVFSKIATATGNDVTAAYDPVGDTISLHSNSGEIILGAANDSSNFLSAMRLANNGTDTVASSGSLGTVKLLTPLNAAGLRTAPAGNGTMTINGVAVSYNIATDSLSSFLAHITASAAGVTASYDATNDRVVLTNKTTGDTSIGVTDDSGGLGAALGLTTGSTLSRGKDAHFTINGGATLSSASNTLTDVVTGITGLSVTIDSESTQTIQVTTDTTSMKSSIQDFISAFNDVSAYIDDATKISKDPTTGKITTSPLSDNREVQAWQDTLRSMAFSAVSGVTGGIQRLDNLGIDFDSTTGKLTIKDNDKLDTALRDNSDDVNAFFHTTSTGFGAKFDTYLLTLEGTKLPAEQTTLNKANASLDDQIAAAQRQIDAERQRLTDAFVAMESAQSSINSQASALTSAFGGSSNTKSS